MEQGSIRRKGENRWPSPINTSYWIMSCRSGSPPVWTKSLEAFFSCLDQGGKVYEADKSVWEQVRMSWMLLCLYLDRNKNPEWLHWAFGHFQDIQNDEWFGYLPRDRLCRTKSRATSGKTPPIIHLLSISGPHY